MALQHHPENLAALDSAAGYDVCVAGSGFVGTAAALRLARSGRRVLVLESGNDVATWKTDTALQDLADYEVEGDTDYPSRKISARARGGNSNFWTGRADRFQPVEFEKSPYADPACPWPVKYEELMPFYFEAERLLNVSAAPFSDLMPPRKHPVPAPKRNDIAGLQNLFADQGITIDSSPTAKPRKALRFFRLPAEAHDQLRDHPNIELVSGVTVTRIEHDQQDTSTVTGLTCRLPDGTERRVSARAYLLGCGGIQTPRLLLLSRSERFPNGLANDSDWVGRGFNEHVGINLYARFLHNRHTIWPRHRVGRSHQFVDHFYDQELGAMHPTFIQSYLFYHNLIPEQRLNLGHQLWRILRNATQATLLLGCRIEMVPHPDNRVTLSEKLQDRFGDPLPKLTFNFHDKDRRYLQICRELMNQWLDKLGTTSRHEIQMTWPRHHMGTTRMGDDPRAAVCDRFGRAHGTRNLYLSGCEVFPTGGSLPPTLTGCALALRTCEHLHQTLDRPQADAQSESMIADSAFAQAG